MCRLAFPDSRHAGFCRVKFEASRQKSIGHRFTLRAQFRAGAQFFRQYVAICSGVCNLLAHLLLFLFFAFAQRAFAAFLASSFLSSGLSAAMRAFTPFPLAALPPFLPISRITSETKSRLMDLFYGTELRTTNSGC